MAIEPPRRAYAPPKRAFGDGPYLRGLRWRGERPERGFPFELPAIEGVEGLDLGQPITLLAGDNGSGKSTLTELVADAMGFDPGGGELDRSGELPAKPRAVLNDPAVEPPEPPVPLLEPVVGGTRPRGGYFLRAESFYNVAEYVDRGQHDHELRHAPDLSLYGGRPLHEQSHGQSFLALAANRFGPQGLYVLDEPEAALSVSGQLALLAIVVRAARGGAQFVIATHSPILLALPGARIYELDETHGLATVTYDALDAVRLTRAFLEAPERFVRAALDED